MTFQDAQFIYCRIDDDDDVQLTGLEAKNIYPFPAFQGWPARPLSVAALCHAKYKVVQI